MQVAQWNTGPLARLIMATALLWQVEDGDVISIDAATKQMNMEVSDDEIRCESSASYFLIFQRGLLWFETYCRVIVAARGSRVLATIKAAFGLVSGSSFSS